LLPAARAVLLPAPKLAPAKRDEVAKNLGHICTDVRLEQHSDAFKMTWDLPGDDD
jgi:hypothetical protein